MTAVEAAGGAAGEVVGEQQRDLADAVRSLLAKRSGSAEVRAACETERGYDEALWSTLCEQIGVAGLAIPRAVRRRRGGPGRDARGAGGARAHADALAAAGLGRAGRERGAAQR